MTIACLSTKSKVVGGSPSKIVSPFKLTFATECYSAPISPAQMLNYNINLYAEDVRFVSLPASVNPNCGPLFYELRPILAMTGAQTPAVFSLTSPSVPEVRVHPKIYNNVGLHTFVIDSCIELGVFGQPSYAKRCQPSGNIQVTIKDPCLSTDIM